MIEPFQGQMCESSQIVPAPGDALLGRVIRQVGEQTFQPSGNQRLSKLRLCVMCSARSISVSNAAKRSFH